MKAKEDCPDLVKTNTSQFFNFPVIHFPISSFCSHFLPCAIFYLQMISANIRGGKEERIFPCVYDLL
jgi:hypothetical protein